MDIDFGKIKLNLVELAGHNGIESIDSFWKRLFQSKNWDWTPKQKKKLIIMFLRILRR